MVQWTYTMSAMNFFFLLEESKGNWSHIQCLHAQIKDDSDSHSTSFLGFFEKFFHFQTVLETMFQHEYLKNF